MIANDWKVLKTSLNCPTVGLNGWKWLQMGENALKYLEIAPKLF